MITLQAVLLLLASAPLAALAQQQVRIPDLRTLLVQALEAPDGQANGVLSGDAADAIAQRFNGTTAIHIDITTLRRYAQPGCSRLNVRLWQDGVQLPGQPAGRRQTIDLGINYCRDGQPPRSLD